MQNGEASHLKTTENNHQQTEIQTIKRMAHI